MESHERGLHVIVEGTTTLTSHRRLSDTDRAELVPCSPESAARALVTSTYMAGELRRYWAFAATLAAGTGLGPSHPPVGDTASRLTSRLPCWTVALGREPGARMDDLLPKTEVETWAS